jgi:hypothetical protein
MLSYRQAYKKAILITSCLALVFSFSYYYHYASSAFATMNAGAGLPANFDDAAPSPDGNDPCSSDVCGPAKIAIIDPTFTAAAYDNSFYNFFKKYASATPGEIIKNDINLLSNVVPSKGRQQFAVETLVHHLTSSAKGYNVTILDDVDVHEGSIFSSDSNNMKKNNNAYDILIIFHNEYVTQEEYQNIKTFVANGGTLFVMDGNVFYAEVKYDNDTSRVALVKGHGWAFDGESAQRGVGERWANETTQWLGSNYLCFSCKITFGNNPFQYSHHEEQYITNTGVTIIKDYEATSLDYKSVSDPKIATYEVNYAKGKVVVMGLYSSDIIANSEFLVFVDGLLP